MTDIGLDDDAGQDTLTPFPGFSFFVSFTTSPAAFGSLPGRVTGGFSEVTGLEATMEPKVIKEGGRNYGPVQRPGPVSFSTVVLKRGVVRARHLWAWWSMFAGSDDAKNGVWGPIARTNVDIILFAPVQSGTGVTPTPVLGWTLVNAMPVKFRAPDLNARGGEVAIEEIHLVHEGLNTAKVS
ncbi:MAG TPA: phage tail protein [Caulobacteraceae bacterium]|nr:phage tail protein [Caulobacteraceae bacterium]